MDLIPLSSIGRKGITANAVAPGFIATPMTQKMPKKVLKAMEEKVPLQTFDVDFELDNNGTHEELIHQVKNMITNLTGEGF